MQHHGSDKAPAQYGRLAVMALLSFVAMYILMYAMVDRASSIHPSLNQAYMAALMSAPMIILELVLMGMMYGNKRWNIVIITASLVAGLAAFGAIRSQFMVGDKEFLRSMIPHHSGAILMCGKASIRDPEIKALCRSILAGQKAEVDQMEAILARSK